jgi:hypothetical protein
LAVTPAGREALAAAMPLWERAQAENEALMAGMDLPALRAMLRALS